MKRLQIMIDEDLDAALDKLALAEGTSKAALIRRFVREEVEPLPPLEEDPIWRLRGAAVDAAPADIDTVVYGLTDTHDLRGHILLGRLEHATRWSFR